MTIYRPQPQWPGSDTTTPGAPVTTPNQGYDVYAPKLKRHRAGTYAQHNGMLNNGSFQWPIFVSRIGIDLSVQGSMAQSQFTRDFYPHNFVQPAFTIEGHSIDQTDYGYMCDFIRTCQHDMLTNFSGAKQETVNLMQLTILHRGVPGSRTDTVGVTINGNSLFNQTIRGAHKGIAAKGFVTSMPRIHEKFVTAPTWSFGFQVVEMIRGPYDESPYIAPPGQVASWIELLMSGQNISTTGALIAENKKNLDWVAANSINVIANPPPPPPLGTSTSGGASGSPTGTGGGGGPAVAGYANPFPGGWIPNRLDNGYDGTFKGQIVAPFAGTITYTSTSFANWGGYVQLKAAGSVPGLQSNTLYFAEGVSAAVSQGARVNAGDPICNPAHSPFGDPYKTGGLGEIEWGVAQSAGSIGTPTDPLTYVIPNKAAMVVAFAKWAEQTLGVAPPSATNDAGHG